MISRGGRLFRLFSFDFRGCSRDETTKLSRSLVNVIELPDSFNYNARARTFPSKAPLFLIRVFPGVLYNFSGVVAAVQ